jgi:hypothetical protein
MEVYYHSADNAVAIYKGAIVQSDVGLASPGSDPLGYYQSVVAMTDGDPDSVGVAWAFGTTPQVAAQVNNLNAVNYCPASTGMYIGVIVDPTVVYLVQDNGTTLTAAQIGQYADIVSNTSGSTVTGRSIAELNQGAIGLDAVNMQILRVHHRPDNELGAWADFEVVLSENVYGKDDEYLTT